MQAIITVFLLFLFSQNICSNPQRLRSVYVDRIEIQTESVGLFTKSIIEVIFHNPNDIDSLEARWSFSTSRNSFVKDLWLEINGELKKAETFSRSTGERIYERITGRRLDPALLRTSGKGRYTLRVFPFAANEYRRIVIELYSTLEGTDDGFAWRFRTPHSTKIDIEFNAMHPAGTEYSKNIDNTPARQPKEALKNIIRMNLENTSSVHLDFFFPTMQDRHLIYNSAHQFTWHPNTVTQKERVVLSPSLSNHELLVEIVSLARANQAVDARAIYPRLPQLGRDLIAYLIKNHGLDILYNDRHRFNYWERQDNYWNYKNTRSILSSDPALQTHIREKFYCSFLDHFVRYQQLLSQDVALHIKEEYLTSLTSKVALEESDSVKKIRNEEVQSWRNSHPRNRSLQEDIPEDIAIEEGQPRLGTEPGALPPPPESEEPIVPFYALSERPRVIKRATPIYPETAIWQKIEGTVVLKVLVNTVGDVEEVEVLRSHPLLDKAAIEAAKQFKFKPAKQKDKLVKVWMSIPFTFKLSDIDKYPDYRDHQRMSNPANYLLHFDKKFINAMIDGQKVMIEEGFILKNALRIEYYSDQHFQLLYRRPDLIKYCIREQRILIALDAEKKKWCFIK